ncbi:MAG: hypothetical protein GQ529_10645 [Methyloprofundus sp.]|nr:hypothetical protein [Methyloprofundus sp.]
MKKNIIKKGIFTALLLASPFVVAGTQYPASDFQPKVVYQDKDIKQETSSSSASVGEKAKADTNYPAATFQPKVVYQDKEYKHTKGAETSKSIPLAMWEEKVEQVAEEAAAESAEESSLNPLFAIVVLGIAAFLYKKSTGTAKPKKTAASSVGVSSIDGLSGVARYLEKKSPKLSGVAKYLEANQSAPKSGVAKYVAKKVVAAKQAASEKVTGVEKYVRNRG